MFMDSMTSKERWLAVLNRENPDRIPMDYWATPEATRNVMKYLGCGTEDEMLGRLHIDKPFTVEPRYVGPPLEPACDMYGCRFANIDYGTGVYPECVYHPLAQYASLGEVEAHYAWPTADWFDYSVLREQVNGRERVPVRGGGSEPFLTYVDLRGMELAYMDLIDNRELVEYCLDKLFGFACENTRRIFETIPGVVVISYVAEDFGSQESLLFSPRTIREVFVPRMKRMIDLVHEAGAYVFFHSDGAVREIIPDMIAAGIDVLNPLQWRAKGMDRDRLKRDFGDRVILHGGVDNQHTIPFGSAEDVRQEVLDNLRILGAGGGYILAPCHNIQAISPAENIVALYETGYEYGRR
jgi:uroporphyrinogen decarboxylase